MDELTDQLFQLNLNQRMIDHGAQNGCFNIALIWNNWSDLDLRVTCPCGITIFFAHRKCPKCHGTLDVDMNTNPHNSSDSPIENVFWKDNPPVGRYIIKVHNYREQQVGGLATSFKCILTNKSYSHEISGQVIDGQMITVFDQSLFVAEPGNNQRPISSHTSNVMPMID